MLVVDMRIFLKNKFSFFVKMFGWISFWEFIGLDEDFVLWGYEIGGLS